MASWLLPSANKKYGKHHADAFNRDDTDLSEWLDSLGLRKIEPRFWDQGIYTISQLLECHLTERDLQELGIHALYARKLIMKYIEQLCEQHNVDTKQAEEVEDPGALLDPLLADIVASLNEELEGWNDVAADVCLPEMGEYIELRAAVCICMHMCMCMYIM